MFAETCIFVNKICYIDEQMHEKVNQMIILRLINQFEKSVLRSDINFWLTPSPFVILCDIFGHPSQASDIYFERPLRVKSLKTFFLLFTEKCMF